MMIEELPLDAWVVSDNGGFSGVLQKDAKGAFERLFKVFFISVCSSFYDIL